MSRVTPVHTALRNCMRDEGRSFEVGNQVLFSSHRKLLLSKAMVVNVAEKSERDFGRDFPSEVSMKTTCRVSTMGRSRGKTLLVSVSRAWSGTISSSPMQ